MDERNESKGRGRIRGWHHAALIVSDMERACRFYEEVLGARRVAEEYREERGSWKVDLEWVGGVRLELFTFPGAPPRPSYPEAEGLRHLALAVEGIEEVVKELEEKGAAVEAVRVDGATGRKFTFFHDPDGLPWELYEAG